MNGYCTKLFEPAKFEKQRIHRREVNSQKQAKELKRYFITKNLYGLINNIHQRFLLKFMNEHK